MKHEKKNNKEPKETLIERMVAKRYKMPNISAEEALDQWAAEMKEVDWKEPPKRLFFREKENAE